MSNAITRLKWIFLGLFAIGVVGIWGYQIFYVWPAKKCAGQERWWDPATRTCATPLYIPALTGRPAGVSREEWSKRQAAAQQQRDRYGERAMADLPKPAPAPEKPAARPAEAPAKK
ncbi:hypothetical protein [Caulobacter sp. NIBR1757]|uniref:hypothetical protein n=1 Tax=Caulobacter sp. NIBR1757 TaxID=3016000 RepID=UPI0022F01C7C|nr:hypothetical protein [Caulobacter sp. NIBR1757]WGM37970.1 hypothetical protein AMEJIAPC_00871 [Caulobacter sp. NIBR1757]